jgi:hypothetical protein
MVIFSERIQEKKSWRACAVRGATPLPLWERFAARGIDIERKWVRGSRACARVKIEVILPFVEVLYSRADARGPLTKVCAAKRSRLARLSHKGRGTARAAAAVRTRRKIFPSEIPSVREFSGQGEGRVIVSLRRCLPRRHARSRPKQKRRAFALPFPASLCLPRETPVWINSG